MTKGRSTAGRAAPPPVPQRYGLFGGPVRVGAREVDGEPGAPLDVGAERRTELGVGREARLVRGVVHQIDPAAALRLRDVLADVLGDHVAVAALPFGVGGGATEDLADPQGDVPGVLGREVGEQGAEELVLENLGVEDVGEPREGVGAACPVVQARHGGAGAAYRCGLVVAHLVDVPDVRPDLGEEVLEEVGLAEALDVVLGRGPGDAQDEVLEVLLAARQFVVDALGRRGEPGGGARVGREELGGPVPGNPVADVLDCLRRHGLSKTRVARPGHEVGTGHPGCQRWA